MNENIDRLLNDFLLLNKSFKIYHREVAYGLTESIEIVVLLVIGSMALLETWLVGIKSLRKKVKHLH